MDQDFTKTFGHFTIGETHWAYLRTDAGYDLWSDDEVTAALLLSAIRKMRTLHGITPAKVRIRMVGSPSYLLRQTLTDDEIRSQLDEALFKGLKYLGFDLDRGMASYGMGSEYRGWLSEIGQRAIGVYQKFDPESSPLPVEFYLAREMMLVTAAIPFSMREGYATLDWTTAVGLLGMRYALGKYEDAIDAAQVEQR